jgi:alanine racemase
VCLRTAGIKGEILILGYSSPFYAKTLYEQDLTQALVSEEYAAQLAKTGLPIKCQFAIDTGMNRIGIDGDAPETCERIIRHYSNMLNINGIFTHLCVADSSKESDVAFTHAQLNKFKDVADRLADMHLSYVHCCNSAAGLFYLDDSPFYDSIGKIVRLGIVLYGLKPDVTNEIPQGIAPALSWKSVISMVKSIQAGESIGYGRTFIADKEMTVATVATGYADGLDRHLSNSGHVLINGHQAPIIGRICMDQTLVDVTNIPSVKMGTHAIILGKSGNLSYDADDMASDLHTIGYEVLCQLSKRVQRFYFL